MKFNLLVIGKQGLEFENNTIANIYCCLVAKSVRLFAAPWTVSCQAPLSMAFPRREYWSGLPFPSPADLAFPGIKPRSPALQEPPGKP